ncbi:glutathione gamma-glutamylcysteinyltransferase 2-like, partial [Orbicella faveolata]|uniref:glutathione gamma-glutamylcysteinyltransferase 2-like n=1 Tax=Orbicella faveolata TaxID=48498 RepID=UPI0009E46652
NSQSKPTYRGISTLATISNSLRIDPRCRWKRTIWRWNTEDWLAFCISKGGAKGEAVGQIGGGQYSPVAALDRETNSVLMLDTARYKYPPHRIPIELIFH